MKIKTIGHYAFSFFENETDLNSFDCECEQIIYKGKINDLTYEMALKIAQVHPNYSKYYQAAMMPLFQGKGKLLTGTESPVMALASYRSKKEENMQYILIWNVEENENVSNVVGKIIAVNIREYDYSESDVITHLECRVEWYSGDVTIETIIGETDSLYIFDYNINHSYHAPKEMCTILE